MSGQNRHIQACFSCTLSVPEKGYSCVGHGVDSVSQVRTKILAAMASLGPISESGYVFAP